MLSYISCLLVYTLSGRPRIVCKSGFHAECMAKLSMLRGFTKGVSVYVSFLEINDIIGYNLPYMQTDFMRNLGPTLCHTQYSGRDLASTISIAWFKSYFDFPFW